MFQEMTVIPYLTATFVLALNAFNALGINYAVPNLDSNTSLFNFNLFLFYGEDI